MGQLETKIYVLGCMATFSLGIYILLTTRVLVSLVFVTLCSALICLVFIKILLTDFSKSSKF